MSRPLLSKYNHHVNTQSTSLLSFITIACTTIKVQSQKILLIVESLFDTDDVERNPIKIITRFDESNKTMSQYHLS